MQMQRKRLLRRWLVAAAACLAVVLVAAPAHAWEVTAAGSVAPPQYASQLDTPPDPTVSRVLTVAHNAGDNAATTRAATAHGAGAIEIDVWRDNQSLVARHNRIFPVISSWLPGGSPLNQVWNSVGSRPVVLDLKSTSPTALRMVTAEINRHPGSRVIVTTPSRTALEALRRDAPTVTRLLTVLNSGGLHRLLADPGPLAVAQGVSIRQTLLTSDVTSSLHNDHLLVQAWTVNTMARLNELSRWGVDGVTTDNLSILDAVARASAANSPSVAPFAP
jgi:hypothetical protein